MKNKVLDTLNEGIIIIDKEYKIQFCNASVLSHLNYTIQELQGKKIDKLIVNEDVHKLDKRIAFSKEVEWKLASSTQKIIKVIGTVLLEEWNQKEAYWFIIKEYRPYTIEMLENALENMPYGIWIQKLGGSYEYCTHNLIQFFNRIYNNGSKRDSCTHKLPIEIWREKEVKQFIEDDEILKAGRIINENRSIEIMNKKYLYNIVKVPMKDKNGKTQYVLGELKQIIHQNDIDNIIVNAFYQRLEKNGEITQVYDNEISKLSGARSLLAFEYNKESKTLEYISRISKDMNGGIKNKFQIRIEPEEIKRIVKLEKEWKVDEICQLVHFEVEDPKRFGVNAVYAYPIQYDDEVLGCTIATYENKLEYSVMEREIIRKLCSSIASTLKNNQLSKSLMKELRKREEAEKRLEVLLEMGTDFISIFNEEGCIISDSKKWWNRLGWQIEDVMDKKSKLKIYKYLADEDKEYTKDFIEKMVRDKGAGECTNRWKCKDGTYRWIKWQVKYLEDERHYYTIGTDITELIESKNQRLMYQETLELGRLKDRFLANISHELKTPINLLYSILQLIEQELPKEEVNQKYGVNEKKLRHYRNVAKQNILRLLRLVDNIMDISKIQSGSCDIKKENYNIIDIIEKATLATVDYVKNKGLDLIFDTQVEEVIMACNPNMIERIILNLLSNAIKYTESGNILVNIEVEDKQLKVSVRDTGIGIPKENLENIFKRFEVVDTSFTRRCEGSGIGLALVKMFVEAHEGTVYVKSEVDKGTLFEFKLPIKVNESSRICEFLDMNKMDSEKVKIEFSDIY